MKALLTVSMLSKSFGKTPALDCASLTVARGEFVAILGPSGSGKSTLFRCVARLVDADSGDIDVDMHSMSKLRGAQLSAARRNIGMVFQESNLIGRRTALENVLAGRLAAIPMWRAVTRIFKEEDLEAAAQALDAVGLRHLCSQRADTLSGGQQQRVAIARALVQNSSLIIADEPVSSLDPENAHSVLQVLADLARAKGIGVLCSLHQPYLAELFADRILYMESGRLYSESERAANITYGNPSTTTIPDANDRYSETAIV